MKKFRIGYENAQGYCFINIDAETIEQAHKEFCKLYKNAKSYLRTITLIGE